MFEIYIKKYAIGEKKRLNSKKTYFKLKKDSLSKKGIFILSAILFVFYISISLFLDKKICYIWFYVIIAYIGGLGIWALLHQQIYKYVFDEEIEECKNNVSRAEKFMMKYMRFILSFIYLAISIFLFLYSIKIFKIWFLPDLCSIDDAIKSYQEHKDTIKECVDTCITEELIKKIK